MTVISIEVYAESRMELVDKLMKWIEILNDVEIGDKEMSRVLKGLYDRGDKVCKECGEELN